MTKIEAVREFARRTGHTQKEASLLVDTWHDVILNGARSTGKVLLDGWGVYQMRVRKIGSIEPYVHFGFTVSRYTMRKLREQWLPKKGA